jgi:carboxypeptidase C (cathepsin A)
MADKGAGLARRSALMTLGGGFAGLTMARPVLAREAALGERRFVTRKAGIFAGQKIAYDVVASDMVLRDSAGEPTGAIFSFAYLKAEPGPAARRPVVFIWNGGPGSSSVWLHMGVLGPRRALFTDIHPRQVPPFGVADNPHSPLAVADLVFIDPIGTGFSRFYGKGGPETFYGVQEDADAFLQFIEHWLNANRRWDSPKYILGESYGTNRANILARQLFGGVNDGRLRGIALNGVVLAGGNGDLAQPKGAERFLPGFSTMAATAWYHGRTNRAGRGFEAFIAESERFAADELVPAIARGDALPAADKALIAGRMAAFTGLSADYVLKQDLQVQNMEFGKVLLADQGLDVGVYDTRYVLPKANSGGDPVGDDPAMGQYSAPFIGAFNTYVRGELGVDIAEPYKVIAFREVNAKWKWPKDSDPGADLAMAMRRNPDLRLLSAQGWFDLFGAVGSADYGIAQRGLPRDRVTAKRYQSGHMCYVGEAGPLFAADLRDFIVAGI